MIPAQAGDQPQNVDMNDSFEDDLGPNFDDMNDLPNMAVPGNALGTAVEQASRALDKYAQHSKGYVPLHLVVFVNSFLYLRQRVQL